MARVVVDSSVEDLSFDKTPEQGGGKWRFVMLRNGKTVMADTRTELVECLIPGYSELAHDEDGDLQALKERFKQAVVTADFMQQFVAGVAVNNGEFDFENASEEELTAFLTPRLEHPTELLGITHWAHAIPLVLVTTSFEPYTSRTPPTGNIVWIDPTNETTYLDSMNALDQLRLYVDVDQA
jgi:hypothetical protein